MVLKVVTGKILETLELSWCPTGCGSVLGLRVELGAVPEDASMVRLSKSNDYLVDNLYIHMLSELKEGGQAENGWAADAVPNWESPTTGSEGGCDFTPTTFEPLTTPRLALTCLRFRPSMFCT